MTQEFWIVFFTIIINYYYTVGIIICTFVS